MHSLTNFQAQFADEIFYILRFISLHVLWFVICMTVCVNVILIQSHGCQNSINMIWFDLRRQKNAHYIEILAQGIKQEFPELRRKLECWLGGSNTTVLRQVGTIRQAVAKSYDKCQCYISFNEKFIGRMLGWVTWHRIARPATDNCWSNEISDRQSETGTIRIW